MVAATIFAPLFGRWINTLGTRAIIAGCQVLSGISIAVYAFVDMNVWTFIVASIIGGIGSAGLVGAPIRFIVLAETDNTNRAAAQGLVSVMSSAGRLVGAAMVGAVAESIGGGAAGFQMAFAWLIVVCFLVLATAMSLKSKAAEQLAAAKPQESAAT